MKPNRLPMLAFGPLAVAVCAVESPIAPGFVRASLARGGIGSDA